MEGITFPFKAKSSNRKLPDPPSDILIVIVPARSAIKFETIIVPVLEPPADADPEPAGMPLTVIVHVALLLVRVQKLNDESEKEYPGFTWNVNMMGLVVVDTARQPEFPLPLAPIKDDTQDQAELERLELNIPAGVVTVGLVKLGFAFVIVVELLLKLWR